MEARIILQIKTPWNPNRKFSPTPLDLRRRRFSYVFLYLFSILQLIFFLMIPTPISPLKIYL
ncbi:hypothetical protein AtNW77_Chr2g0244171 [Arabidopsis thaliana]